MEQGGVVMGDDDVGSAQAALFGRRAPQQDVKAELALDGTRDFARGERVERVQHLGPGRELKRRHSADGATDVTAARILRELAREPFELARSARRAFRDGLGELQCCAPGARRRGLRECPEGQSEARTSGAYSTVRDQDV
jgi:hypothetical protein